VSAEDIVSGMYLWDNGRDDLAHHATILFSGSAQGAVRSAQAELAEHFGVGAQLWSVTSYKELRRDALEVTRWNRLHPDEAPRVPRVTTNLESTSGPIVAVTDFLTLVPDQVARWVPRRYLSLGTDGFGRSDTRDALRSFFEVDTAHVVIAVLAELAAAGEVDPSVVRSAIERYGVDPEAIDPANSDNQPREPRDASMTGRRIDD
jgi:pyruvate dehydrogenase E1 component